MSRYNGPQHRGAAREVRQQKHSEAIERNWQAPDERRRWYREGRPGPGLKNARKAAARSRQPATPRQDGEAL